MQYNDANDNISCVEQCLLTLEHSQLSFSTFLTEILRNDSASERQARAKANLLENIDSILNSIANRDTSLKTPPHPVPVPVRSRFCKWLISRTTLVLQGEIARLVNTKSGFQSNAKNLTIEQVETLSIIEIGEKFQSLAPCLTSVIPVLLDSVKDRRIARIDETLTDDQTPAPDQQVQDPDAMQGVETSAGNVAPQNPSMLDSLDDESEELGYELSQEIEMWLDDMEEEFLKKNPVTAGGEAGSKEAASKRRKQRKSWRLAGERNEKLIRIVSLP